MVTACERNGSKMRAFKAILFARGYKSKVESVLNDSGAFSGNGCVSKSGNLVTFCQVTLRSKKHK